MGLIGKLRSKTFPGYKYIYIYIFKKKVIRLRLTACSLCRDPLKKDGNAVSYEYIKSQVWKIAVAMDIESYQNEKHFF